MTSDDAVNSENHCHEKGEQRQESSRGARINRLSGMTLDQANEYVKLQIVAAKRISFELKEVEDEIKLWSDRTELARQKGMEELAIQASARVEELKQKRTGIEIDLYDVERTIPELKRELERMAAFTPSVDADQLLDQLEQMVGKDRVEEARLNEALSDKVLDDELAALKSRLHRDQNVSSETEPNNVSDTE